MNSSLPHPTTTHNSHKNKKHASLTSDFPRTFRRRNLSHDTSQGCILEICKVHQQRVHTERDFTFGIDVETQNRRWIWAQRYLPVDHSAVGDLAKFGPRCSSTRIGAPRERQLPVVGQFPSLIVMLDVKVS
jgi:hypothetical protein